MKALLSRMSEGDGAPGTVLDGEFRVACGSGAVRLLTVQREGRSAQDAETFLRGFSLPAGTRLA